jgi:glycosyltransferase involved in cell wall biosynthesis
MCLSSQRPKRILLLSTCLSGGGAESQVKQLAIGFKRRGCDVLVVSMITPTKPPSDLINALVPVESLAMSKGVPDPRAVLRLHRFVARFKPDVLHAHMIHANLLARVLRLFFRVRALVCTAHNTYEVASAAEQLREVTWREWAYRLTDPLCDLTTQICEAGRRRYLAIRAVPQKKLRLIPNGVNLDSFAPDPVLRLDARRGLGIKDEFLWLAVGRLDPAKDYRNLLEGFSILGRENARLVVAGEGPLKQQCQEIALGLGINARVGFLGARDDVSALMKAADGFVMSSFYEGLPLALIEAMASGLPAVATEVGGNSDIVIHGRSGLLVPPRNAEALALAMGQVMGLSHSERSEFGKRGREHVCEHFGITRVIDKWLSLYDELLQSCPAT